MAGYDRAADIKAFDDTKAGVQALLEAGTNTVPRFFHQAPDPQPISPSGLEIPIIDLHGVNAADCRWREEIVAQIRSASEKMGFFQVVNHGVPGSVMTEMLDSVHRFHSLPAETRRMYYSREAERKVSYKSNFDLFQAPAANWRDSMFCLMAPEPPQPDELPQVCREITFKYSHYMTTLGKTIFELLSEALGLASCHLQRLDCSKGHALVLNYYPLP
ncbi:hypothetical protein HPP92_025478 [Vanilla planifolia]|uniref:Non-haem dioxygenase N-terminal domain-containing protein n=1 Tax=Vanilla planifolia TaxID=51239 RepID=A0A835U7T2_VANPL|nr:hypothetical protein HPP92_025478 [Vanilla planifolia]